MYQWIGKLARMHQTKGNWCSWLTNLPPFIVRWFTQTAGLVLYLCMHKQRAIVHRNMKLLLTERWTCKKQKNRSVHPYVRAYFVHVATTLYELFLESGQLPEMGNDRIKIDGHDHLHHILQSGQGAIIYAPHMGNMFYLCWRLSRDYRCLTVGTASSPELQSIYSRFEALGCQGLDYDQTPPLQLMRKLKQHLQSGGIVLLFGDFHRPTFPATRLFGRATQGSSGAAMLAMELKLPVLTCYSYREKGMNHRIILEKPIYLDKKFAHTEREKAMLLLNDRLERMITSRPEQWLYWFNVHERFH